MHIPTINSICGEVVSTAAFVLAQPHLPTYQGGYFRLVDGNSEAEKAAMFKSALNGE
ncbi:BREX-1 system adenine-specific DNA-methyltransferase PglX [Shewanella sp. SM20]|uniref:BREX-1 system adenine-specific DNA-methyltransferase PglX n=1 Tax=Shewanella sp. SM20 TaxID=2912792 RepID=UPI0021DA20FD|nr:BREX-1 system adenine-specific DNA-methyltransferase PglX [Shewanella sp. SM20]MCU8092483.1 BREX-1 system adenine-specific DNA-methyltransferase PglX [Shewanella sp. SM20]